MRYDLNCFTQIEYRPLSASCEGTELSAGSTRASSRYDYLLIAAHGHDIVCLILCASQ